MTGIPTITLANGVTMPALGFGTSPMSDAQTETAVTAALGAGYRLIDTAENYGNEGGVGRAIRASGIDRDEVFVTTKFNKRWHDEDGVRQALANSEERLGLERIDLLLIHWPNPQQDRYVQAWLGMIGLLEAGQVRAIGVSNFKPAHLDRLLESTGVAPSVNQIELNPYVARLEPRAYHERHGIVTQSYSPLDRGGALLREPVVVAAAERLGRTPAQVVLRWHVQQGLTVAVKSSDPARQAQNLAVFDFALGPEELAALSALDRGEGAATDSDTFGH